MSKAMFGRVGRPMHGKSEYAMDLNTSSIFFPESRPEAGSGASAMVDDEGCPVWFGLRIPSDAAAEALPSAAGIHWNRAGCSADSRKGRRVQQMRGSAPDAWGTHAVYGTAFFSQVTLQPLARVFPEESLGYSPISGH